ncbi:NUDIX domain-containing protein [Acinetobacter sp.]|jgi:8-oxo-dGTP pyrophosphatase MutT (NUDIX family)|uniref:NUDIX domain-containing protein n=1 Tax=Acinetobacter sp. TaxID=472 RepID=UPI0035B45F09
MEKVCPFILRKNAERQTEVLVFQHPESGIQLVKGTLEANEPIVDAALRELYEESGIIRSAEHCTYIGQHHIDALAWHFVAIDTQDLILAEQWQYQTLDDYGHVFSFFWMPAPHLLALDGGKIRSKYIDAIRYILLHR